MFIDAAKIFIKAGNGGNGCCAFRREAHVPRGGPDGGDGGDGGNVIVRGNENLHTLLDFKYQRHYRAENGAPGNGKSMHGKNGNACIIPVPVGTIIMDNEKNVLFDITAHGQSEMVAMGGKGGRGNKHFATPVIQAPDFAEKGAPGEEKEIFLELKLIADVGIVGLPNAGKSTLLSRLSSARPKIADYPFTTLEPNLGIVKISNYRNFVMADIPGIIEGAHLGKGLGHNFLKHIERTKILLFLVDISSKNIYNDFKTLFIELENFKKEMANKPFIIAINKIDLHNKRIFKNKFYRSAPIVKISALSGKGTADLVKRIEKMLY